MTETSAWSGYEAQDVTLLLRQCSDGDSVVMGEVFTLVYRELKMIAAIQRRKSKKGGEMLNTTALVHEAWLRLRETGIDYENRRHFLAIAGRAMHQVLIDQARRHLSLKRGGDQLQVTLHPDMSAGEESLWMVELDKALEQLGEHQPRLRDLFQLRFFLGLSESEVAKVLDISDRTVQRDWIKVRAFMAERLELG